MPVVAGKYWPADPGREPELPVDLFLPVTRARDAELETGPNNRGREEHMVKIRLTRLGSKKRPFYRVMAIDERKQRDGRPLEFLGTYDPRMDPPALNLNLDGIDGWLGKGAQLSDTVKSLVGRVRREGNTPPAVITSPAAVVPTATETSING
jgi:small subunit ribosomal protein S16